MNDTQKRIKNPKSLERLGKQVRLYPEQAGIAQGKVRGIRQATVSMLDVNFGEDAATVRKDFAADNLSRLKKIVLNVLRVETATTALGTLSLAKKRKLAAWNDAFRMANLGIKPIYDN